jgi:very-short-patch-repair endonuclease
LRLWNKRYYCNICKKNIDEEVYNYSMNHYKKPLCRVHQKEQKKDKKPNIYKKKYCGKYAKGFVSTTDVLLYNALRKRNIQCDIAKFDGNKTVDIAIKWAKIYIEIDGTEHRTNPNNMLRDIKRDEYSSKKGYHTLRFTKWDIEKNLDKIADTIAEVARERYFNNYKK